MRKLLTLLISLTLTQQCQDCVHMSFHSCWICYENCQQGQIFHNCTQQVCGAYYYDSDGDRRCSYYTNVTRSQQQCFNSCCESGGQFSQSEVHACKAYNDRATTILIAVLSSVFGTCFLVGICCCFCHSGAGQGCRDCLGSCLEGLCFCLTCQCFRRQYDDEQAGNQSNVKNDYLQKKYEWEFNASPNNELMKDVNNCAICLVSQTDTITNCGHNFHLRCLSQWINRNQICPLCNGYLFNPVRYICRNCFTNTHCLYLNNRSNYDQIMYEIRGPNCPHCS